MTAGRKELIVVVGAAIAIGVVIVVTLLVLGRRVDSTVGTSLVRACWDWAC
jgi:hypothetical protein